MRASARLGRWLRMRPHGDAAAACARQRRAYRGAALLVRVFYGANLYLVALEVPQWREWSAAAVPAPLWPVWWIRLVGAFTKSTTDPRRYGVEVTGPVRRERALAELERIDVFVAPSFSDGCPNAVLEAAAAGRTILCSRVGAMADLFVDGESAYFLRDWTLASMRAALADLDRDAALRARLGAGARRVAEALTVAREIEAWDLLLRRACSARPDPARGRTPGA
jgi:glycosyltransferase involved in cell wall biosynthesis